MAIVYPQYLPEFERKKPSRRAEILLYDKLTEQLGDKWLVLYGAAIKWKHNYGVSDRETEFIVAHPDLGVVFIEVKGGLISREGNIWYTSPISESHIPFEQRGRSEIKNPYLQVTDSSKSYKRKVEDYIFTQRLPNWSFEFSTAVCFPDVEIPDEDLGADALRELTLDRNDLGNLRERLYQILKTYQGKSSNLPPGESGIDVLKKVLARDWHLDSYSAYQIQDAEQKRKKLTEEQFELLYELQDNPKMLIRGCAGSGKTLLAAKKAQYLASLGYKVLLTCYNENLAKWIQTSEYIHSNIRATDFHQLCSQEVKGSKVTQLPSFEASGVGKETYFKKMMPEALELAALEKELNFDAIIVDEGQDFEASWLTVLDTLLKDPKNGIFYIFYDDNQRIYNQSNIPFPWFKYRLSKNLRNTDQIFKYVRQYYGQPDPIKSSGVDGPEPWFFDLKGYDNEIDAVQAIINSLVQQKIPITDVAILTPRSKDNSIWAKKRTFTDKYKIVWNLQPFRNQVASCSIHSFKGLEKPVIILTELEHLNQNILDELLYIGISRAKDYLIIVGDLPLQKSSRDAK